MYSGLLSDQRSIYIVTQYMEEDDLTKYDKQNEDETSICTAPNGYFLAVLSSASADPIPVFWYFVRYGG